MTRYVFRNGHLVHRVTGEPMLGGDPPPGTPLAMPRVLSDLPVYVSPLGDGMVEGRAARREHLKRTGCREVEPSEWKPSYINERFAAKHGLPFDAEGAAALARARNNQG